MINYKYGPVDKFEGEKISKIGKFSSFVTIFLKVI